ncbi:glycoside hydrolase domain-containing protein [Krasilnikovia sp. MM14-A1259]|uniref:glycoside hydrolase domain-containing protein n=1 Tax=Krasilnikovia sp. MM14-A1259 TaxID=3373539 RepID=UPI00381571A3
MDSRVLETQRWLNKEYGSVTGFTTVTEDGITGWDTMHALTRALQYELGISPLSDTFGKQTLAAVTGISNDIEGYWTTNRIKIAQCAFYCKGYDPGGIDGTWGVDAKYALNKFMADAGLPAPATNTFPPKVLKALLTMDPFVVVAGGTPAIRQVQQWLNSRYTARRDFFLVPCDGIFSRDVQKALYLAIQFELGMTDDQATGTFGPGTKAGLKSHPVSGGSSGPFVGIFTAAMVFNRIRQGASVFEGFADSFGGDAVTALRTFQKFSALPETGTGDFTTWCQLLVSTGDPDRPATACDGVTAITDARAAALRSAGYEIVGRYLDNKPGSSLNKKIQPGELDVIFRNQLRVFPISQYNGGEAAYFTYNQGYQDARAAHAAALGHGFDAGTVIYFAVDFDATQKDVDDAVIPYFIGVSAGLAVEGKRYIHGVYGSRNVCADVTARTNARWSFVSGMSTAYSGNMGYTLPDNWAFNQVQTLSVGAGGGKIEIDKDAYRPGTDPGVISVGGTVTGIDLFMKNIQNVYELAKGHGTRNPSQLVLEWLRYERYDTTMWRKLIGDLDHTFIDKLRSRGLTPPPREFQDPGTGITVSVAHFAASCNGVLLAGAPVDWTLFNEGDVAGWGGDWMTFYGEWRRDSSSFSSGLTYCREKLAKTSAFGTFKLRDLVEDADAFNVGMQLRGGANIVDELDKLLRQGGHRRRFRSFLGGRFLNAANARKAARTVLMPGPTPLVDNGRVYLIQMTGGIPTLMPSMLPVDKLDEFCQGFADTLQMLADDEAKGDPK